MNSSLFVFCNLFSFITIFSLLRSLITYVYVLRCVHTVRFLKYVRPFFNILKERVNPAIEWVIIALSFDVRFIIFYLDYFINNEFFFTCILQLIFLYKTFFTVEITNNICLWHIIFYFLDHKHFLRPVCNAALWVNILIFWVFSHNHQLWI